MWNNPNALNFLSKILFGMVAIAVLYAIGLQLIRPPFFPIKEISINVVRGETKNMVLQNVTNEQIEQLVKTEIDGNFISVNLTAVREAFVKLPWVREAKVNREWPHGLNVTLEEHRALAYWGSHALVNTYGEVFRVSAEMDLPVFTGPNEASAHEVTRQYQRFNQILAPLQQKIAELILTPRYAWRIQLDTGTVLELGRDETEERLIRYVSIFNHSIALLNQQGPLAYVDLRYPNGFAIRTPDAAPHVPRKSDARRET
ncbi:cell division protein FtsQ/DivIB [Nitrosomonas sp. sh817]|uniref:cell division protein FtsQ/DivIB n=1 Tax=Nitrosomonas sp. sh817 TaxID=3070658 RepID=UPI0027DD8F42|nr:cell division protein FtsQ/DivIB [Nitrosomonas sp. sh817]WMJ08736.1 cell division protein FtsQ/DivIB [Nitrosomonas sp. sh817]